MGIEGGLQERGDQMFAFAWVVIESRGKQGESRTAIFQLPQSVADLVRQGRELGDADDTVFNKSNSKEKNGAVGLLTNDIITRKNLYMQAVVLALIPFMNDSLY